ncbi:MAG: HlyD family efflux transporter periplasmic adaptor subunit [Gammaproteobacteria bacterium]
MQKNDTDEEELRRELGDPQAAMTSRLVRPVLWIGAFSIIAFIAWASWAEIDEVTRGEGKVVPSSRLQKIQSLEGGILDKLLVKEGDVVEIGQTLLLLDKTRFYSAYMELKSQSDGLKAAIARLEAEVLGHSHIKFPKSIDSKSALALSEQAFLRARQEKHRALVGSIEQEISLAKQQLSLLEPLVKKKAVSELEALRLRKDIASLTGKLNEIVNNYTQEAYTELAKKRFDFDAMQQTLLQREDQLRRTEVQSPVKGMVNDISITTRGGIIQPGDVIMQITPIDDQLLIEAKIKPADVAFIAPGMPARVKITAYDYTVYGDLAGTLEQISADTIEEQTVRGKETFYKILVRTDAAFLQKGDKTLPIKPGMIAEVDVLSGKRSVLNYLLRPLIKAKLY